ncbi:cytidylyltransferase domain-containing protein, partial [Paramuribaculum intestinale]
MPRLIYLIPIRKGSKGVPDKNMKILGGKPLVAWVVDAITASHTAAEIWVATD